MTILVEGQRRRQVRSHRLRNVLERVLGRTRSVPVEARGLLDPAWASSPEVVLAPSTTADGLIAVVPDGTRVVVSGARPPDLGAGGRRDGRADTSADVFAGAGTAQGNGAFDRLAAARALGATHLLLGVGSAHWLRRCPDLAGYLARHASIAAANEAGVLWDLPVPPLPGEPKLFCIGLTKTGTSSLHAALTELGFRSIHYGRGTAHRAVMEAHRDGERLLRYVGEEWDAFGDIGSLSQRFDLADLQYPGSRFILTVRDVDEWIDSRHRHIQRNPDTRMAQRYSNADFDDNQRSWRAEWYAHLDRVTTWFTGREELLVLDVCGGDGWNQLAPFVGRSIPRTPFPTENIDREGPFRALLQAAHARQTPTPSAPSFGRRIKRRLARAGRTVFRHRMGFRRP